MLWYEGDRSFWTRGGLLKTRQGLLKTRHGLLTRQGLLKTRQGLFKTRQSLFKARQGLFKTRQGLFLRRVKTSCGLNVLVLVLGIGQSSIIATGKQRGYHTYQTGPLWTR